MKNIILQKQQYVKDFNDLNKAKDNLYNEITNYAKLKGYDKYTVDIETYNAVELAELKIKGKTNKIEDNILLNLLKLSCRYLVVANLVADRVKY